MAAPTADRDFIRACLDRTRAAPETVREACRGLADEDTARRPGAGKLSIFQHMAHLLEMERNVFGVRLRRVLAETNPRLDPVNQDHDVEESIYAGRTFGQLFDEWAALRRANVELVEGTGPAEWARPVRHPDLGDAAFADVVDRWSRHDTDHLRQIEIIARNCRERNLP